MRIIYKTTSECEDCDYFKSERHYTPDSFENVFKWWCTKSDRLIAHHETFDNEKIPDWCTLANGVNAVLADLTAMKEKVK